MLILNPNNRLKGNLPAIEPPLWAGLIASYHNADILDAEGSNLSLGDTEDYIRQSGERDILIVVMGNNPSVSSTPKMPVAAALADKIKDLNVSMTGIHPIACGSSYPVVRTPFRGFPMMPWHKLPMNEYRAHNWHCLDGSPRYPYASIYTSLGCPYACYYCNIHTLYGGRSVQFRPILDVITEVDTLVTKYNVRNIKIWDELFALKESRVIEICEGLKEYNLNIWAYARLDTITEKMLAAMKRGGVNWLAYGFESVSDLKFARDTEIKIRMTRDAGINIIANFMFGLPGATLLEDEASFRFANDHLFEWVNFYTAMPYPGSKWYEDSKPTNWPSYNQYEAKKSFRNSAFERYFTNPDYLSMITRKFGEQAVKQVKEMLAVKPPLTVTICTK